MQSCQDIIVGFCADFLLTLEILNVSGTNIKPISKDLNIIADRNKALHSHTAVVCAGNSRGLNQPMKENCSVPNSLEHLSFEHLHAYLFTQTEPVSVNFPMQTCYFNIKHITSLIFILQLRKSFISYLKAWIISASN